MTKLNALGIWMKSPMTLQMMISRHLFDTIIVSGDTDAASVERFTDLDTGSGRLKVAIVGGADVLLKKSLRAALADVDRLILIDSPDMLEKLGVRLLNMKYAARGRWTPVQIDVDSLTESLRSDQDLSPLKRRDFDLPQTGPEVTRLASGHLYHALPKMISSSPEADPQDIGNFCRLVARYAAGLLPAAEFKEATKTIVRHGGNPSITPRIGQYLKKHRQNLQKGIALYLKFRIKPSILQKHFGKSGMMKAELPYVVSLLSNAEQKAICDKKVALPDDLRSQVGSDAIPETMWQGAPKQTEAIIAIIEQFSGKRPNSINEEALSKLRKHVQGG